MSSSSLLHLHLQRSKPLTNTLRFIRVFSRSMGGGPRTFPGGLNKWQWKRLHEKKAKEKEKRLLQQEKQLYQARIRSQIRTKLFSASDGGDAETAHHKPMTPDQHVKALADRFMKEGAEDLWNEDDGPLKPEQRPQFTGETNHRPIDLRNLISDKRNLVNNTGNVNTRNYSVLNGSMFRNESASLMFVRNLASSNGGNGFVRTCLTGLNKRNSNRNQSSSRGEESDFGTGTIVKHVGGNSGNGNLRTMNEYVKKKGLLGRRRFTRNESSSSEDDSDFDSDFVDEKVEGWRDVKRMGSSASLGRYDMKITKRVPLKNLEKEYDFSEQVESIRKEISKRKLVENEGKTEMTEQEPILSQNR